jgi:hypothetical protein
MEAPAAPIGTRRELPERKDFIEQTTTQQCS